MTGILQPLFIITPVLLALALGIIGFVFMYQRRMMEHQDNVQQLQETKQRQLLDATMQAQEVERRRVARDLHDEVGTMLALIKLNVHQLTAQAGNNESSQYTKKLLEDVISSVRHISHNLIPVVLDKMGLPHAIKALKNAIPAGAGVEMTFTCDDIEKRLDPKTELMLYRVVQELLSNTIKHARATAIRISLACDNTGLHLVYEDNGIGFDYKAAVAQTNNDQGLGLRNMQARVEILNGVLNFHTEPGHGVKATISVPNL